MRQLDGVGPVLATKLSEGGAGSLATLCQQQPGRIDAVCGKAMPFGSNLVRGARALMDSSALMNVTMGSVSSPQQKVPLKITLSRRGADTSNGGTQRWWSGPDVSTPAPLPKPPVRGNDKGWVLLLGDAYGRLLLIRRVAQDAIDAQPNIEYSLQVPPSLTSGGMCCTRLHERA